MLENMSYDYLCNSVLSRKFLIYHIFQYGPNSNHSISYTQEVCSLYGAVPVCIAKICRSKPSHRLDLETFNFWLRRHDPVNKISCEVRTSTPPVCILAVDHIMAT
jgi:hypothetical protein